MHTTEFLNILCIDFFNASCSVCLVGVVLVLWLWKLDASEARQLHVWVPVSGGPWPEVMGAFPPAPRPRWSQFIIIFLPSRLHRTPMAACWPPAAACYVLRTVINAITWGVRQHSESVIVLIYFVLMFVFLPIIGRDHSLRRFTARCGDVSPR